MHPDSTSSRRSFLDRATAPHLFTLIVISGLSAMAMNAFLPFLPEMANWFAVDYKVIQLSIALYLISSAVLQLILGPLSDYYGRRRIMLIGLVVFCLMTLGCIYAPNIYIFLLCRIGQAVVVVGIVVGRAIIRDITDGAKAASMIGYVTAGMALMPMFAPAVGGFVGTLFNWQAVFWMFFILAVLVLMLGWADLGETRDPNFAPHSVKEQLRDYLSLLKSVGFWGYCVSAGLAASSFFAYLGGTPLIARSVFNLDSDVLGLLFGIPALGYLTGNYISGRFAERVGLHRMMVYGGLVVVCGSVCALTASIVLPIAHVYLFFGFMTIMGFGNGLVIPNATAGLLSSVHSSLAGAASGLSGTVMIGFGAIATVISGVLVAIWPSATALLALFVVFALCSLVVVVLTVLHATR